MDGEEILKKLICLQDVGTHALKTLLTHFVFSSPHRQHHSHRPGEALYDVIHHFSNYQEDLLQDLRKETQLNKDAIFDTSGNLKQPVNIDMLDITSLCIILNMDIDVFLTRSAKCRKSGWNRVTCQDVNHLQDCCPNHNHPKGEGHCRGQNCNKDARKCLEESAPCCNTCRSCYTCMVRNNVAVCDTRTLRDTIHNVYVFRSLVAHTMPEEFEKLNTSSFTKKNFPRCNDFASLWLKCSSDIKSLLKYLQTKNVITRDEYDDFITEIIVIQRKPFNELERIYFGPTRTEERKTVNFKLKFEMGEISSWCEWLISFLGWGRHRLTEKETDINSNLSDSVERYVKRFFEEEHSIDNNSIQLLEVVVLGNRPVPTFHFTLKPKTENEEEFLKEYADRRSSQSKQLWVELQKNIGKLVADELGINVAVQLCKWVPGSIIITTAISKICSEWKKEERIKLYNLINLGSLTIEYDNIFIESVTMTPEETNSLIYKFRINCSKSSILSVQGVIDDLKSRFTYDTLKHFFGCS